MKLLNLDLFTVLIFFCASKPKPNMHHIFQTSLSALIYNCTLLLFIFELVRAHNLSATYCENYQTKLQTLTW